MQQYTPNLGELCHNGAMRDAIHIAVAPVVAGERLLRGHHVRLSSAGEAIGAMEGEGIGIVDPFLTRAIVEKGQTFWLFLYPGSITGLRHVWQHPAFTPKPPERK